MAMHFVWTLAQKVAMNNLQEIVACAIDGSFDGIRFSRQD